MGISSMNSTLPSASVKTQVNGQCILGKGTCTNCGQCGKPVNNVNTTNSAANIGPAAVLTLSDKSVAAAAAASKTLNPYEKMNL